MTNTAGVSRRLMLAAPMILGLANAACAEKNETRIMKNAKTLVAYITRSGNTRVIAGTLQRALEADLFEIRPARPYPEDYEQHVVQARRERDSSFEPPLAEKVANMAAYDEVYLGFPIWGETMPPPVRSFLKTHDLRGKTIRPFITHGGYGVGSSLSALTNYTPGARIEKAFVMEADQERRTMNAVHGWLTQSRK